MVITPDWGLFGLIAVTALVASMVAAVTGFGGSAIVLPALIAAFGARDAIVILTVLGLIGNLSRVWINRKEIDLNIAGWFAIGAIPLGLIGGFIFANSPLSVLTRLLGILLVGMVAWRHLPRLPQPRMSRHGFAILGAVSSFISALVGTIGPLLVPFFLSYGLMKGAFIGTEALSSVVIQSTKIAAYSGAAVMSPLAITVGVALGPLMVVGSHLGGSILGRLPGPIFIVLVEGTMLIAGIGFILTS